MAPQHWNESAEAWVEFVDSTDANRAYVLDPAMLRLVGNVSGQRVLDVGCGEGRFCRLLAERGAVTTGIDPTTELLAHARKRDPSGAYIEGCAESLSFNSGVFDTVVSYVSLCDVSDYRAAIDEMARVTRPGGSVVIANLNGFASACPHGWERDESGKRTHFALDNYTFERGGLVSWRGINIVNYHRPISDYIQAFLRAGLILDQFEEPIPSAEAVTANPYLADFMRIPVFVVMRWRKL